MAKKVWWHDRWDKAFKIFLHKEAVVTPKFVKTLNDLAKEEINTIVEAEKKELTKNWNVYAIANNKRQDCPHENKVEIEKLIRHFEYEVGKMQEVVKSLKILKAKL